MKRFFLFTLLTTLALHSTTSVTSAQKPPAVVRLSVTIQNTLSDGVMTPAQIKPVGDDYVDGVDGVTAQLGSTGNFIVNFWPGRGSPTRDVYFNHENRAGEPYSGPLAGSPFPGNPDFKPPLTGNGTNPHAATRPPDPAEIGAPYVAIQSMDAGDSQCVQFYWGYGSRDLFHLGVASTDNVTAYAVVTRDNADQWTISSRGTLVCPGSPYHAALVVHDKTTGKNSTVTIKDGYWYMPFELTLRRKP